MSETITDDAPLATAKKQGVPSIRPPTPSSNTTAEVARHGWDALMAGKATIISGFTNELHVAAAGVPPQSIPAEIHRDMADRLEQEGVSGHERPDRGADRPPDQIP